MHTYSVSFSLLLSTSSFHLLPKIFFGRGHTGMITILIYILEASIQSLLHHSDGIKNWNRAASNDLERVGATVTSSSSSSIVRIDDCLIALSTLLFSFRLISTVLFTDKEVI
ncbi:hypothetical protein PRIPAC_83322 [Pristionchus pacificus]|uniref:Uncharacterized protein n=1 Tax=Pristionchus pacificus TaxID=54126 RepID=A0A2A6BNK2_PRIPA|nr:hypothetical protein PRIPAC_87838 [Pristionchus pacificus]KAF8365493.1 hypothetical protein PRIPAC_83322 [Pristionchus pacificus]|eukprot:PDM67500.1 hypothetical protein PRIPAC_48917 [Pristionchus pacificus]